jgi:hypothetical protein
MESMSKGELVASTFPIREQMSLSTLFPNPFGAFPKRVRWLMLSFDEYSMEARPMWRPESLQSDLRPQFKAELN